MIDQAVRNAFPGLSEKALLEEISSQCVVREFPPETTLIQEEEYVKFLPLLVKGTIRVFREDPSGRELLLYYIRAGESCIVSFHSAFFQKQSTIRAVTEEACKAVLVPAASLPGWQQSYPSWNSFIIKLYHHRFEELLAAVNTIAFSSMEDRLRTLLWQKAQIAQSDTLKTTHQELADALGTAREVISRLLKKSEIEGKISLSRGSVKILERM